MKSSRIILWLKWVLANSAGELIGLGATFAIGAGLFSGLAEDLGIAATLVGAGLMTATGALEGAVVGLAQWLVLRVAIPGIGRRAWVVATVIGAVIAWFLGSVPMVLVSLFQQPGRETAGEPSQVVVLLLAAGMGLVAGLILSVAQWLVLRKHVQRAWLWLPANALAWAAGMPLIFAAVDLALQAGSAPGGVVVMAAGITLTGAVVGAIHGVALLSLAGKEH